MKGPAVILLICALAALHHADAYGYGLVQSSTSSYDSSSSYTRSYGSYGGEYGGYGGGVYPGVYSMRPYMMGSGYSYSGYRPGGYGFYSRPYYSGYDYSYNGIRPYYSNFGYSGLGGVGGAGGVGTTCITCGGMGYYKKK